MEVDFIIVLTTGMQCTSEPPTPPNGRLKCVQNVCQVSCLADYKFSTGDTSLTLGCINGRWMVKSLELNEIPACERNYFASCKLLNRTIMHNFFCVVSCLSSLMQKQRNLHCTRSV